MGLFFQPPAEVLPTPAGLVVGTAFGNDDVLRVFADHYHRVVRLLIFIFHDIARPELIPAWAIYPPPWEIAEGRIGTQRGPAGAVDATAIGAVTGGAVGCWEDCPGGISLLQLIQDCLHTFFRDIRGDGLRRQNYLLLVVGIGVNVDAVGGRVIGYAKIHRPADVPEPDVVAPADEVGGERCLLAVDVECLGAGSGGEIVCRLGRWATQRKTRQNPNPHKDCFSFSASHYSISLRYCVAFGKQQQCQRIGEKSRVFRAAS